AGIIGQEQNQAVAANLINNMLVSHNKKTSVASLRSLIELGRDKMKSYIHEIRKNGTEILILKIDVNVINGEISGLLQQDLRFNIILYIDVSPAYKKQIESLLSLLEENGIIIVNEDYIDNLDSLLFLKELGLDTVTFGFNSRASITTSSIDDTSSGKKYMLYQQKTVKSINGHTISPQEYRIDTGKEVDAYGALGAVAFAIASGVELNAHPGVNSHKN
ncbi:MAG: hypothetical protein GX754_06315, partial [Clostridiaceae bacterium]|nr:hypothetical protein [Clostridiaceae bacterium]